MAQAGSTQTRYMEWVELGHRLGAVRDDLPRELVVALCVQVMACGDVWFSERAATATAAEVGHFARAMTDLSWRMWHRHGAARPSFESHAAPGADSPRGMARASASRVKGRRK